MTKTMCRHILPTGHRCGSPALRDKPRCYHHDRSYREHRLHEITRREAEAETQAKAEFYGHTGPDGKPLNKLIRDYYTPPPPPLEFPPLEDRSAIQIALSMVLRALAHKEITPREGSQYLYCLQIASANLKGVSSTQSAEPVTEVVLDEEGNELAPDEDAKASLHA